MRANIDDGTRKTIVAHRRHRDKHLPVEKASNGLFPGRFTRQLHDKRLSGRSGLVNAATCERDDLHQGERGSGPDRSAFFEDLTMQLWRNPRHAGIALHRLLTMNSVARAPRFA